VGTPGTIGSLRNCLYTCRPWQFEPQQKLRFNLPMVEGAQTDGGRCTGIFQSSHNFFQFLTKFPLLRKLSVHLQSSAVWRELSVKLLRSSVWGTWPGYKFLATQKTVRQPAKVCCFVPKVEKVLATPKNDRTPATLAVWGLVRAPATVGSLSRIFLCGSNCQGQQVYRQFLKLPMVPGVPKCTY
jgi:hypothetical protein